MNRSRGNCCSNRAHFLRGASAWAVANIRLLAKTGVIARTRFGRDCDLWPALRAICAFRAGIRLSFVINEQAAVPDLVQLAAQPGLASVFRNSSKSSQASELSGE